MARCGSIVVKLHVCQIQRFSRLEASNCREEWSVAQAA
jgi:hypothetical protein